MKISKLFHWLYATLMFLPLIFFVPSAFYYGFNEHAVNETTTEVTYKYESNEVNSLNDLVQGNIYYLDTLYIDYQDTYYLELLINIYKCDNFSYSSNSNNLGEIYVSSYSNNEFNYLNLSKSEESEGAYLYFTNENSYTELYFNQFTFTFENVIFSINDTLGDFKDLCNTNNYLPQYTDYNVIESVIVNTDDTITNKMYLAWVSLWDLPVFAWTKTCFLSAGFTYISGLFGVSATNSLNYVFGYWITISICWLVFDLLIYVPNLAHRWLDKGAIE